MVEAKQEYEAMFGDDPVGSDTESMRELFPDLAHDGFPETRHPRMSATTDPWIEVGARTQGCLNSE